MKDQLLKAIALDGKVRIFICNTTGIVNYAKEAHDLWPTASAALGRTLSVASMMGANLKSEQEKITIMINGGGPIGTVMAEAFYGGNVRGFVGDPHVHYQYNDTGKLAVGVAVGKEGYLEVVKDLGMKETFGGKVVLQSGEIGDDFSAYFLLSEQTPSVVSVGVLVDTDNTIISSGGLLVQLMPGASEEDIQIVEDATKALPHMSELLKDGRSLEDIALDLFDDTKVLEVNDIAFTCNCSKEKVENAIRLINVQDIAEMITKDHGASVNCQYCNKTYEFSEDDLREIIAGKKDYVENQRNKN